MSKEDTNDAGDKGVPSTNPVNRISMSLKVEPATKWIRDLITSEPSKWLPILFSLIAIGISSLSWLESRRGRVINEEVNRPILMFNGLETTVWRGRDDLQVTVKYNLKNAGKVEAVVTKKVIQVGGSMKLAGLDIPKGLDCKPSPLPYDDEIHLNILPGLENSVLQTLALNKECGSLNELEFHDVSIVLTYSDKVSGRLYLQEFDVDLKLDMSKQ